MSDSNTPVAPDTDDLEAFEDLFHGEDTPEAPEDAEEQDDATVNDEDDSLAEDDSEDEQDDDGQEPAPKKNRFQERINDLTAKAKDAERREKAWEDKYNELLSKSESKPQPKVETADGAPTPDDKLEDGSDKYPLGEFDPAFIRDLTRHTINEESAKAEAEQAEREKENERKAAEAQLVNEWTGKLEASKERYPDLLEKNEALVETFADIEEGYGEYLATTIMQMDHGVDVIYFLANNPVEAKRIVSLGPIKATVALGRLESQFFESADKKKVSQAPEPPITNRGNSARKAIPADTDDLDAFEAEFYKKK